jgi:uncharacterized protein YndB with AHSA1/START domain
MAKKTTKKPAKSTGKPTAKPAATKAAASKDKAKGKTAPAISPKKVSTPASKSSGSAKVSGNKSKPVSKAPAKPVAKTAKPVNKPAAPAPKAAPAQKTVAKPAPAKPAAKTEKAPAAKPVATKPAPKSEGKPSSKKAKKIEGEEDEPVPEIIPIEQLPILPSDIHYKRPKGKVAPGTKRLVKTETINPHVIKDKPIEPEKAAKKKEPAGKFEMEFILHAPIGLLYDFLTTPSGLAEWFADDVDLKNDIYTFDWDGSKQHAKIVAAKLDNFIRLHWLDKPDGTYFEFRILADELTNEISLMVTDFGDGDDDIRTSRQLWQAQIQRLIKSMGTY